MKKILVLATFLLSFSVKSENMQVNCHDSVEVVKILQQKYEEVPILVMKNIDTEYVLFYNEKKKSWSYISINGDIACLISDGIGLKVIKQQITRGV